MSLWIKICGVTSIEDALFVAESGADAIGLNFAPVSSRCIDSTQAEKIVRALREAGHVRLSVVGVFVDASFEEVKRVAEQARLSALQLHGDESPSFLHQLIEEGYPSYKALRIGSNEDVELASKYGQRRVLVDAKVPGAVGGTGQQFDWKLIEQLNQAREMILAGGLRADNVAEAVRQVRPFGVDTASGVESAPGIKDKKLVKEFVDSARKAAAETPVRD